LREFNPDTDQGVIDTSNLYKTLWESAGFYSNTRQACATIPEQAITPPFNFSNPSTTYTCAFNRQAADGYHFGGAVKELDGSGNVLPIASSAAADAAVKHGVFGFVWTGDHEEYGSMQAVYDESSKDLSLDIATWVDYDVGDDYCYRNDIDGNTETHRFSFRSAKGTLSTANFSVVGHGYSEGVGQHFLLQVSSSSLPGPKYFCIGAEDGEAELMAMDAAGSDDVPAACADFADEVAALTHFTAADLACESADFNTGVANGMVVEGTIFLNYTP